MSLSLTVMLALLMQSRRPPIVLTNPPICKDVAVTVKSIEPKHYRFQLDILNDSSGPIVLLSRLDWNLVVKNASRMEDDDSRAEHRKSTSQLRSRRESSTREVFKQLDLGGAEPTDHPGGSYRVTFTYLIQPMSSLWCAFGRGSVPCKSSCFHRTGNRKAALNKAERDGDTTSRL
jgi:hypothetical protein